MIKENMTTKSAEPDFLWNGFPCSVDLEDPKMFHFYGVLNQHLLHPLWEKLKDPLRGQVCDSNFCKFATSAGSFDYLILLDWYLRPGQLLSVFSWEGVDKYDGPWQGNVFIKWVLSVFSWEGVDKYDEPWQGNVFIKWVLSAFSWEGVDKYDGLRGSTTL